MWHRHAPSLSIILLTHATSAHLAAFAHCCKYIPLFAQIPVYATSPVIALGRTLIQDIYASTPLASTVIPRATIQRTAFLYQDGRSSEDPRFLLQPPTAEEIASYFNLIHPLKYSQPHQPIPSPFSPPLNDLTITAYNAGHSLGGALWHIQHGMESIVYSVDWNQARENVFAGAAWLSGSGGAEVIEQLRKPTALVCSARGAETSAPAGGRAKRDTLLLDMIRETVEKGGSVLIPTDTSARVLEIAYMLEHAWRREASDPTDPKSLRKASLHLASRKAGSIMRQVRSMLEWMDESVVREFESESTKSASKDHKRNDSRQGPAGHKAQQSTTRTNGPFEFGFLKIIEKRQKLDKLLARATPKVILASDSSLEWGFSKTLLEGFAANPNNLVILTDEPSFEDIAPSANSTAKHTLWKWLRGDLPKNGNRDHHAEGSPKHVLTEGKMLKFTTAQRIPLEGRELAQYQQILATQKQAQNFLTLDAGATMESSADAVDEGSSSSSSEDESDSEKQGKALNTTAKTARFKQSKTEPSKEALGVNVLIRYQGVYDYDVRDKKGRDQTFPFVTKRRRADDFGELIKPEDYLRAEERDEIDGQDLRDSVPGRQDALGLKRKWQDSGIRGENGRTNPDLGSKRRRQGKPSPDEPAAKNLNGIRSEETDDDVATSEDSEPEDEKIDMGPARLETKEHSINAQLKVAFVDFAGIHDQRSLTMLIPLIQPKKLILTGGKPSETAYLAEDCRPKLKTETNADSKELDVVFTPINGQMIDASVDTNAWTVKLSESLTRRLHWQNVRGLGVVTLAGRLSSAIEASVTPEMPTRKKMKTMGNDEEEGASPDLVPAPEGKSEPTALPVLENLPTNLAASTRSVAQPLHVGDLRLADLRKILQSTGHNAEFRGEGTLLIDGLVAVRKSGTGKIELEGGGLNLPVIRTRTLEGSFHAVKRKIYDGLAVIAGG